MIKQGIDLSSDAVRDFCTKWKIRELSVFGSILGDDFGPESDVDFLVVYASRGPGGQSAWTWRMSSRPLSEGRSTL